LFVLFGPKMGKKIIFPVCYFILLRTNKKKKNQKRLVGPFQYPIVKDGKKHENLDPQPEVTWKNWRKPDEEKLIISCLHSCLSHGWWSTSFGLYLTILSFSVLYVFAMLMITQQIGQFSPVKLENILKSKYCKK